MRKQIFVSLFIATVIVMLSIGLITPILPLYAKSMHATGLQLGFIFSGFAVARGIFAPFIGQFSDNYGRKKLIIAGLILFIFLSFGFVLADSPLTLTIVRFLQGFSTVLVTPVAQGYIGDITPVGKEGKYMNLFFMSFFTGQALGPYLGGYLTDSFSINMPFYVMAGLSVVSLLLVLFFVPESEAIQKPRGKKTSPLKSILPVFKDKPMKGIMTYMVSRGFYRWGFNTFFPILAVKAAGLSTTNIGLVLSAYMFTGSVIQYPFGIVVDRFQKHKLNFILYGGLVSALAMAIFGAFQSLWMFMVLSIVMGVFSAVSRASAVAIRTERGRIHGMGAVAGAFTTSFSLGQILGPLVFGIIVDYANIPIAFLVGGIVGLTGTFMAYYFLKSKTDY